MIAMPEQESVQLQSWLELICQMIPGIKQAVLLTGSVDESEQIIQWPQSATIHDDLKTSAKLAYGQQKTITTTLSSTRDDAAPVDMVIALPLTGLDGFTATLSVLVNIKPSQQSVVMQLLHWGESWLQLLCKQQENQQPVSFEPDNRS